MSFLDVGCGVGRVASALTRYLSAAGTYDGFDVVREPVEWCLREISSCFPNFQFQYIDSFSKRYNPRGDGRSSELVFPYDDDGFDFVFAGSIYTHMLPEEVANYVAETARVLKPGGTTFATFCLLNERSLAGISAGLSSPSLPHAHGEFRIRDPADPGSFIAQPEQFVREIYRKAKLRIDEPVIYGSWADVSRKEPEIFKPHGFMQDIVIGSKP